ncbi:MAG: type II CAAX endopeptidase family protein [Ferruginibacter sp.]
MTSSKEILLSLFAILIVLLVPHSGIIPLPFGYCIPILFFVWYFLKQYKETFAGIGFSFKRFEIRSVLIGSLAGILIYSFLNWVFFPVLEKFIELPPADLGGFAKIKGNTGFYIFLLAMGWIVGGFYEELIFHGFIFTRIEKMIPGKYAVILGFLLTNIIFAFYHAQLGIGGVINAFLAGSAYHALMLYYKRNMWYAVFAHAVFDTIALTFMYAEY